MPDTPVVASAAVKYPARYYVSFDSTATQPTTVLGWFDMWEVSNLVNIPSADNLIAISASDWAARQLSGVGVKDGKLVSYTPPVPQVALSVQANSEDVWIQQQAALATAMGETFTDEMKAYVKAVRAIADGTDSTSIVLPARPTDIIS